MGIFDMTPVAFKNQKYNDIKKSHQQEHFTDPEFPPEKTSLFYSYHSDFGIEWKRPKDICDDPKFVVDGFNAQDIVQGALGNCWFVAACSALTHKPKLLAKVIPDHARDAFSTKEYAGVFRFHFWRFGEWVEVVVDDLLPTKGGKLIYASSKAPNEFWSSLLEKAFAKLVGSYEALSAGGLSEALVDMSGGVPESVQLPRTLAHDEEAMTRLFRDLREAKRDEALLAACIKAESRADMERPLPCGLVKGHAYAITALKKIKAEDADSEDKDSVCVEEDANWLERCFGRGRTKVYMVRLQNPWGGQEWNGPWSDGSSEWESVTESQKKKLGLTFDEDGEFWMPWPEFCKYITEVCVVHQMNTAFISFSTRYVETSIRGEWKQDLSKRHITHRAGGCPNYRETFLWNPQFAFDVPEELTKEAPIFVSLMQRDVRDRKAQGASFQTIGMQLMRIEKNREHRCHALMEKSDSSEYINSRSVFMRLRDLFPGRYVLIPTTFEPGREADFLLRFYLPRGCPQPRELVDDLCGWGLRPGGIRGICHSLAPCCPHSYPKPCIYSLKVIQGHAMPEGASTYVSVECDGTTHYSAPVPAATEPHYNFSLLFLRREAGGKMMLRAYESVWGKDRELGYFELDVTVENKLQGYKVTLMEPKTKRNLPLQLSLAITHNEDPASF